MRRFLAVLAAVSIPLLVTAGKTAAQADPYTSGTTGYDVSYPQCPGASPPVGTFGIVGVNGGRPFTFNSCLANEYGAAPTSPAPSLYINTGYSGAYRRNISSNCSSLSSGVGGSSAEQQAWAIGCSEAETSLAYATGKVGTQVAMWWLDVETGNSWSTSNQTLNQNAIQGAISRLGQTGRPVGVYSSPTMWTVITGGNFPLSGVVADWEASGGSCGIGFTNSPVWLVQSVVGGVDRDYAC